jgi:3' terminal RNA ribose 2'-O-methyltransferase Hen1
MMLTISTTHRPATDLGYLLHKNPGRVHELELGFGRACMLYPEANENRCTFALTLDVDPVGLVRREKRTGPPAGEHYVNDRPYAVSSFLSVAMARGLRNALAGNSKERPELAVQAIPLEAILVPIALRGDEGLAERLFRPLGYEMAIERAPLDETFPDWGLSAYARLSLKATCRLADLLRHLYVLIPVLDRKKHYFIARDELEKLMQRGEGWLGAHPERELIARRYLDRQRSLAQEAIARLVAEDAPVEEGEGGAKDGAEEKLERPIRLHDVRLDRVAEVLKAAKAKRVADLGCGEGKLIKRLMAERSFSEILGVDISTRNLSIATERLKLDRLPARQKDRVRLVQGALTYRDKRIEGFDAATLVEVIEHLDFERLGALERVVFEHAKPGLVVVTTPNREFNARFEGMAPGSFRHADHRFEWTRAEFREWCERVGQERGYSVSIEGLGEEDPVFGCPSQMAVFERG